MARSVEEIPAVEEGQLTFDAEGTEGGRYHSREPHVPSDSSGITIGRGYDMNQKPKEKIMEDLLAAGLKAEDAKLYAEIAPGLRGEAARKAIKDHHLPEITVKQQEALFSISYREMKKDVIRICNKRDVVQKYGKVNWDATDPRIRDILVDLRYRGDYTPGVRAVIQRYVVANDFEGLKRALKNPIFSSVPPDRQNIRCQYGGEAPVKTGGNDSAKQSALQSPRFPGGVALTWESIARLGNLKGAVIKAADLSVALIGTGLGSSLATEYLRCALLAHSEAPQTDIAFSLDPEIPTQSSCPWQKKVLYPPLLAKTVLADTMFQADFLMKKLAFGLVPFPPSLAARGLCAQTEYAKADILSGRDRETNERSRLWFVVTEIVSEVSDQDTLILKDVRLGVQARKQIMTASGLVDTATDPQLPCSRFAAAFSRHFDEIASHFPEINELKVAVKAVALSQFIIKSQVQMDLGALRKGLRKIESEDRIPTQHFRTTVYVATCQIELHIQGGVSFKLEEAAASTCSSVSDETKVEIAIAKALSVDISSAPLRPVSLLPSIVLRPCVECSVLTWGSHCKFHSPTNCSICFTHITGEFLTSPHFGFSHKVHRSCLLCGVCGQGLDTTFVVMSSGCDFRHPDCNPLLQCEHCWRRYEITDILEHERECNGLCGLWPPLDLEDPRKRHREACATCGCEKESDSDCQTCQELQVPHLNGREECPGCGAPKKVEVQCSLCGFGSTTVQCPGCGAPKKTKVRCGICNTS